jgi:hypothetical protein
VELPAGAPLRDVAVAAGLVSGNAVMPPPSSASVVPVT